MALVATRRGLVANAAAPSSDGAAGDDRRRALSGMVAAMTAKSKLLKQARDELRTALRQIHGHQARHATEDADRIALLVNRLDQRIQADADGGEDEDDDLTPAQRRLASYVYDEVESNRHELSDALNPLLYAICKRAVVAVMEDYEETGFCTFDFHRTVPEFRADGECTHCGHAASAHLLAPVCPERDRGEFDDGFSVSIEDEAAQYIADDLGDEDEDEGEQRDDPRACSEHVPPPPFVRDYRLDSLRAHMSRQPPRLMDRKLTDWFIEAAAESKPLRFLGWVHHEDDTRTWPQHLRPAVVGVAENQALHGILRFGQHNMRNEGQDVTLYFELPDGSTLELKPGDRYWFAPEMSAPLRFVGLHRGPVEPPTTETPN